MQCKSNNIIEGNIIGMTPPLTEQQEKVLNKVYYKDKNFFGRDKLYDVLKDYYDISRRQVQEWLNKQEVHQLYAIPKKKRTIQNTILNEPNTQVGIDLMDMQNLEIDGFKYVLTAIDLFSKKAHAIPLKNKEDVTVAIGMKKILDKIGKLKSVRSDNGSEFISNEFVKLMADNEIKHIFSLPHKPQSNGNIERFNGVLKRLINMSIKTDENFNWVKDLETLTDNYNSTKQVTTGERPDDVEQYTNYDEVKEHIKKRVLGHKQEETLRFVKGDKVRIHVTDEKNKSNFSKDIYTIKKSYQPRSKVSTPCYYLEEIEGKYYNNDLIKVESVENKTKVVVKFQISSIVKPVVRNKTKFYQVKWTGYKDTTVEPRTELMKDVPKMVNQFDKEHSVKWLRNNVVYES